jgi:3'(2'), 5'-bisphosphate nucleotidase
MYDDHALARELAQGAGERLLRLREERGHADPRALRDEGDRASHDYLADALARHVPGDAVLSEESAESRADETRLTADRVWIIDPLDGTREYGEEGRSDWAVHVALWQEGRLTAGSVALPAQDMTLSTTATGTGGAPGGELPYRRTGGGGDAIRIAVSRTRPPEFVQRLAAHLDTRGQAVELVPIGSAGAKISAVLLGTVDAYVHAGGQYEWDSAAPAAVAMAAGVHASRVDGSALAYNQKDFRLPDILVCLPELSATLLAAIDEVTSDGESAAHDAEEKSDDAAQ